MNFNWKTMLYPNVVIYYGLRLTGGKREKSRTRTRVRKHTYRLYLLLHAEGERNRVILTVSARY